MRSVVEILSSVDWKKLGVLLAVVHGSSLYSSHPKDLDLVIIVGEKFSEDDEIQVMAEIERVTGIETDIYVVKDPVKANCFLLLEALRKGFIVHQTPEGREVLIKAVNVCNDFMISRRKLGYTKTLVERVLK